MTTSGSLVLYAEDSEDDAFLMRRAFAKANSPAALVVVPHGLAATQYLAGENVYADRTQFPLPGLVLLDVKMPHASGLEVLTWIRGRDQFRDTPVVMLTSSSQSSDIATAYAKGADAYLVKPTSLDRFREFVEDLLQVCAQPRRAGVLQIRGCVATPASAAKT